MGEKVRRLTCIVCPIGCEIEVLAERDEIIDIKGYRCPRGRDHAFEEMRDPKRIVMTVLRVRGGDLPTVSVKTDKLVPKRLMFKIIEELSGLELEAPIKMGQVIIEDILNTHANVVATRPVSEMGDQ
jgi:CxxC motif-containing protein